MLEWKELIASMQKEGFPKPGWQVVCGMTPEPLRPSPQLFFETVNAYHRTAVLKAAVELGLFDAIGTEGGGVAEIAAQCGCPERGVRILLDMLTLYGFLTKTLGEGDGAARYQLTQDTAVFLTRGSPAWLGGTLKFLLAPDITGAFGDLAATVRQGRVHTSEHGTTAPDHPVWVEFAETMAPMMQGTAQILAGLVEVPPAGGEGDPVRILDISASHGAFGLAFAVAHPHVHLAALDWESVLAVTERNAAAAGVLPRFNKVVGDAFTADLGTGYELVLVPNFLHHFNKHDCVRFLKRVHGALRSGGRVVIVEFVPNEDRVSPPPAAGFSLVMLGTTPEGDAYTFGEYQEMLTAAGFRDAALHPLPPTAESAVVART